MGSDERFTAAEWYEFLVNEVKLPQSAKDEIEKLAQKLATEYMSKNDFIDLSEDDLKTNFKFERIGLLKQFTRWKNSLSNVTPTRKTTLPSNNNNDSSSARQKNPLLGVVEIFKMPINHNQIAAAKSWLETNTANVSHIAPNYLSAIDALEIFGDKSVPQDNRVYYRCKSCDKQVWVAKGMDALTEFPACFDCQKQWLSSLCGFLK